MIVREIRLEYRARPDLPAFDSHRILNLPREAAAFLFPILGPEPVEVFVVLCLTTKYHVIAYHEVSRGDIARTLAHPREVFKPAIFANAAVVLVGHNHPSGDPEPSPPDIELTTWLAAAGELLGIQLLDHVIIGAEHRYYSFKEGGRI